MQAARGTTLGDVATPPVPSSGRVRTVLLAAFVVLYAADQATKWLAVDRLTGQPDKQLVGDLLVLHLTRNPGAAFSTGTGHTWLFTALSFAAVLVVLWLSRRVRSVLWAVAFGTLLAGILGNFTDRVLRQPGGLRGHVVDFLMLPHWPIFNIADMCINLAAGLILVQAFRGIRLDGSRLERHPDDEVAPS
jgi:signal peptidase II